MADASQAFVLTVPAGSGSTVPTSFPTQLPVCDVTRALITWPAGCVGLVGVALQAAGTNAFPNGLGQYVAYEDYTYKFDISNQINSGDWNILAYNADFFAHTIQVILEYDYIPVGSGTSASALISV